MRWARVARTLLLGALLGDQAEKSGKQRPEDALDDVAGEEPAAPGAGQQDWEVARGG